MVGAGSVARLVGDRSVPDAGKLIAGFGLPGSGKSSVMKCLGELHGWQVFLEPEEDKWAAAVHERDRCGHITALTWFRAARVPLLYEADRLRCMGATTIVDTFYDKLVHRYLGRKGMEWLMSSTDPYFGVAKELARLDYEKLPDCDCLIFFQVDRVTWDQLLSRRNRKFDSTNPLRDSFETSELFLQCAKEYCAERSIPLIEFSNEISTPIQSARALTKRIKETLNIP